MNSQFYSGSLCENLGETILITALLTTQGRKLEQQKLKNLADECIISFHCCQNYFTANSEKIISSFNRAGKLFGSAIFQYGIVTEFDNYRNILVWFFLDKNTELLFKESGLKQKILELFEIRHKIVNYFQDASEPSINSKKSSIYNSAEYAYTNIKGLIKQKLNYNSTRLSKKELEKINTIIIRIIRDELEYSENLAKIEKNLEQIVKNTRQYHEKLLQIASLFSNENDSVPNENEDIKFLVIFGEDSSLYFEDQIEANLRYLRDGSQLIEKGISAFRTQIQIGQAERERSLQNTILILTFSNIGMAAAGISASSYDYHRLEKDIKNPVVFPYLPAPLYIPSICYSLLFGLGIVIVFVGVPWLIFKILPSVIKCAKKLTSICSESPVKEAANPEQKKKS